MCLSWDCEHRRGYTRIPSSNNDEDQDQEDTVATLAEYSAEPGLLSLGKAARQQNRGMRRFAKRRRTLAAFGAIIARIGATDPASPGSGYSRNPFFKNNSQQYRKLVEDHSPVKRARSCEDKKHNSSVNDTKCSITKSTSSSTSSSSSASSSSSEVCQLHMSYDCGRCGHTQKFKAEELNNIVGNAFRMAYVAQLQQRGQSSLQDVIDSADKDPCLRLRHEDTCRTIAEVLTDSLVSDSTNNNNNSSSANKNDVLVGGKYGCRSPTPPASIWGSSSSETSTHHHHHHHQKAASLSSGHNTCSTVSDDEALFDETTDPASDMNLQLGNSNSPTLRLSNVKTPNTIPGLRPSHGFGPLSPLENVSTTSKSISQQSTPSSEESNSPTELNSYKRLADKPPLIKRLTMGLTGGRDNLGLDGEDDSCPLVGSNMDDGDSSSNPTSPMTRRPSSGGYINEAIIEPDSSFLPASVQHNRQSCNNALLSSPHHYCYGKLLPGTESLDNTINSAKNFNIENNRLVEGDYRTAKRRTQLSGSGGSVTADGGNVRGVSAPTPPPLPERHDSLNKNEETELRRAPWFQAGIPREITLEVLSQEPDGAFMVRESTSKPGCYALSLRVPRDFQPSGIAHYLIMRTNKGYKIKGFTKEFTTLTSLITHHSVMQELLPCPLSLSRYNPSFVKSDSHRDFADIDSDPDYSTLADFRKMMADLNV